MQRAYKDHRDHPRACGEQPLFHGKINAQAGSSPRVRGAACCSVLCVLCLGIIPARAGSRRLSVFHGQP